jgi:ADP-heptose:LPS heptosyltransferase
MPDTSGKQIWLINKGSQEKEICIQQMRRWIKFPPLRPVALPYDVGINYLGRYGDIVGCENPQKYFAGKSINHLINRDAGIGDLLLLEPMIRAVAETNHCISVVTRYPEVYENHPDIKQVFHANGKQDTSAVKIDDYELYTDLRSYSERSPNRHKVHRSDIYAERLQVEAKDKEPRLYFKADEKCSTLKRKKGYKYIGVQLDASHSYRRYHKPERLIEAILKLYPKCKVVILGDRKYVDASGRNIVDLQGKTSIREAINVIRELDGMVAVDSGLMHVALTLHIPTVCLFTIITPDLRLRYYTGKYKAMHADVGCIGCGDLHMSECKHGDIKKDPEFVAPCMNISPESICDNLKEMEKGKTRDFIDAKPIVAKVFSKEKLTMPIIVQNEEKNLPRFIELVMNHPCIGRVVAIDGGSTDRTVELLQKAGAEVYVHPYLPEYHDMQAMQRNISCSYLKDGERALIMDIDECFSKELSDYLPVLCEAQFHYGIISRRTYKYYADITNPDKQIKDYPDWQPRFYRWRHEFKFVGGAHHRTLNVPDPQKIQKDIIHFECEGKDRGKLEGQWAKQMAGCREVYA